MNTHFYYGTLCHPPLLAKVLGRDVTTEAARLPGHAVFWAADGAYPVIVEKGAGADGVLLRGLGAEDQARLDFYEGGFGYHRRIVTVETSTGPVEALVYFPEPGRVRPAAPWRLSDWLDRWGAVAIAAAGDFMREFGRLDGERLGRRYPMMLMRAGARVRAEAESLVPSLRRAAQQGDVAETSARQVYANYFAVEEYELRFRRFDGAMSPEVNRAVFVSGDAAVVLPYDPVRDRVLVIEQFRMGPHGRGDPQPWLVEAIAGRVDGGETPETAALREAREEAGLEVRELIAVASYYPSPAMLAEYLYTYVGLADLPDGAAGIGGLPGEAEDIRAHLLSFDRLMELVASGEVNNAPLLILAYWLDRNRSDIRGRAAGA
ncbi:MAG: gamma-glutamylcyclotransferase [Paracoccaceae bacterium]